MARGSIGLCDSMIAVRLSVKSFRTSQTQFALEGSSPSGRLPIPGLAASRANREFPKLRNQKNVDPKMVGL